ncbi:uncharacterized protein LOC126161786 isoform X1 [Schistocerca cancellata]|uniref:uncharacterized protein LOC126161786 isoform X1 n=1 Tax=Schistocerca cancellata TaxID=274614 RepID=UPI0021182421|nr:uncharacterized protein LOC126161786 isoform X1 [Schistocerca cancellata]
MDHAKCIALIKLYKSKEPLWNVRNPYYRVKSVREQAWKEISDEMKMPLHLLKRKMTILLASYRSERYRMKKSRNSGSAAVNAYESKWFAFQEFNFMAANSTTNDTADSLPDEYGASRTTDTSKVDSQGSLTDVAAEETRALRSAEASASHRARSLLTEPTPAAVGTAEQNRTLLREVFEILKPSAAASTDAYVTFGQHIANELRKYDPTTLAQVKHAINNVIYEADMERYSNGRRRAESTARNPMFAPTTGVSSTPSMHRAKQENEENEALDGASVQDTLVYIS